MTIHSDINELMSARGISTTTEMEVALWLLFAPIEPGSEVYFRFTRKAAKIVINEVLPRHRKHQIKFDPDLVRMLARAECFGLATRQQVRRLLDEMAAEMVRAGAAA